MAGAPLHLTDKRRVHSGGDELIPQKFPLRADAAGVPDFHSGPGKGHRLIQALSAAVDLKGQGAHGLPGLDEVVYLIDVVDVQRAEVQYAHL